MSKRPSGIEILRIGILAVVCSAFLLSPAGAAQVDYFKGSTPAVPGVKKPQSKLPAIQKTPGQLPAIKPNINPQGSMMQKVAPVPKGSMMQKVAPAPKGQAPGNVGAFPPSFKPQEAMGSQSQGKAALGSLGTIGKPPLPKGGLGGANQIPTPMPDQGGPGGSPVGKVREAAAMAPPKSFDRQGEVPEDEEPSAGMRGAIGPSDMQGKAGAPGGADEKGIIVIGGKPGEGSMPGGADEKGIIVIDTKPGGEAAMAPPRSFNKEQVGPEDEEPSAGMQGVRPPTRVQGAIGPTNVQGVRPPTR